MTPQTLAHQAPRSMEFSRQGCWSGVPFPSPEDLPDPGIEPWSSALAGGFFTTEPLGKPQIKNRVCQPRSPPQEGNRERKQLYHWDRVKPTHDTDCRSSVEWCQGRAGSPSGPAGQTWPLHMLSLGVAGPQPLTACSSSWVYLVVRVTSVWVNQIYGKDR